jgi:hypothetical protein
VKTLVTEFIDGFLSGFCSVIFFSFSPLTGPLPNASSPWPPTDRGPPTRVNRFSSGQYRYSLRYFMRFWFW